MKSLAAAFCVGVVLLANTAFAQTPDAPGDAAPSAPVPALTPNEAAGLPNLEAINRPGGTASSKVELNTVREPSYHTRERSGTEVTEFRDRGKPTEIDVRSNFGTHYQMSNPIDNSPRTPSNGSPNGRVPSIRLSY